MPQVIPQQGNIFGRIGAGIGQGLSEQLPKEMERGRLAQGLQQFEQESANLNPIQQLARLSSIPGITPQMIQSFGELAKQQNVRNAYRNRADQYGRSNRDQVPMQEGGQRLDVPFANITGNEPQRAGQPITQINQVVRPEEVSPPQANPENPLDQKFIPGMPWSQKRFDNEVSKELDLDPQVTVNDAIKRVSDREARELSLPEAEQKRIQYFRDVQDRIYKKFDDQLQTRLQKSGAEIYGDITGDMKINLQRSMERDLRLNRMSEDDAVNKWTTKALDLAKTKKQFEKFAGRDFWDKINPTKKSEALEKLKSYQKIYAQSGNQEEFYNNLMSKFNLSPQGAATIAFPISKDFKSYVEKNRKKEPQKFFDPIKNAETARRYALEAEKYIKDPNASILSMAKALKDADPNFDQDSFFAQIREDWDNLGLTERQGRELPEGKSDTFPNWGDIWLLPIF